MDLAQRPRPPALTYGQQLSEETLGLGRDPRDIPPVGPNDPRIPPPQPDGTSPATETLTDNDRLIGDAMTAAQQAMAVAAAQRGEPPPLPPVAPPPTPPPVRRRIVVTYGPEPSSVCVAVEETPDWEMVGDEATVVSRAAIVEVLPLLKLIVPVKNMVPGLTNANGQRDPQAGPERVPAETARARAPDPKAAS